MPLRLPIIFLWRIVLNLVSLLLITIFIVAIFLLFSEYPKEERRRLEHS